MTGVWISTWATVSHSTSCSFVDVAKSYSSVHEDSREARWSHPYRSDAESPDQGYDDDWCRCESRTSLVASWRLTDDLLRSPTLPPRSGRSLPRSLCRSPRSTANRPESCRPSDFKRVESKFNPSLVKSCLLLIRNQGDYHRPRRYGRRPFPKVPGQDREPSEEGYHVPRWCFRRPVRACRRVCFLHLLPPGSFWPDSFRQELAQLRQGAAKVGGDKYRPTFTFVVCAKRHHMRFFGIVPGDMDRTGNLPAGTVVDKAVTHPYAFDFYCESRLTHSSFRTNII